ncbi:MAG: flagellar basal body rod protein FlgB [Hyphomicrobiales bacterium]|nr:flagellar basal body rod protein FlgB [Hyphomicrobiales bacterium]
MGIGDLSLMDALKTRMQWHQARQQVIAENVANADTPRYRAKDLAQPQLPAAVAAATSGAMRTPAVRLAVTEPGHMTASGKNGFQTKGKGDFEVLPSGNAVDLEEQMTKSAENQLDYQTVASLYQQSLSLLRTALGKK